MVIRSTDLPLWIDSECAYVGFRELLRFTRRRRAERGAVNLNNKDIAVEVTSEGDLNAMHLVL